MLNEKNRQYVSWGLTALAVVVLSLLLSFFIDRFGAVRAFFGSIVNILMPIIYGAVMAFLMAPMYNAIRDSLTVFFEKHLFREKTAGKAAENGPGEQSEKSTENEPVEPAEKVAKDEPVEPAEKVAKDEPVEPAEKSAQNGPLESAEKGIGNKSRKEAAGGGIKNFFEARRAAGKAQPSNVSPMRENLESYQLLKRPASRLARAIATFASIAVIIIFIVILIALLIPQIIKGISDLFDSLPSDTTSMAAFFHALLKGQNEELVDMIITAADQAYSMLNSWIHTSFLPNINTYLSQMTRSVVRVFNFLKNFFIGLIVMAYALNMKELLSAQTKRVLYAIFPLEAANMIVSEARYVKLVFSQFIVGKIIDSLIIGVLCYICLIIMNMPYALIISTFVGVTNIIPFFGPFIGAIPSALILLLVSPIQALQFCIFILILQQIDGNIIGPRILGSTTGISSFWVLFSILFFGGLWGIVGMVIGIPTFAILARFFQRFIESRLGKKDLPKDTGCYDRLKEIDPGSRTFHYRVKEREADGSASNPSGDAQH